MGFNTVALFLNDRTSEIVRDGAAVIKTLRTCLASGTGTERFGGPGGIHVLPSVHADGLQLIAAGGNTIRLVDVVHNRLASDEDIARALADKLGFRLVRKRAAPTPPTEGQDNG